MIEVKINGVAKWQVNEYTFNDPQMGIRSINMTVKHPSMWVDGVAPDTADFTGAYVDYEGEKYSISSSKPTAEKSNTSLDYIYTLIFKGEEEELTRRKVRNLALVSFDNYVSQGTTFSIYADINQFKQLLENNLKHYFGNKWSINLSVLSSDSVRIDVSNVTLWDLLSKTYEYFGVRFNIRGNTINIGYEPEEIYHVFDYGNDGGLVKITKTAPDTSIVNRLSGMGGSRNVPMNYFTDRYSEFAPDPNPINSSVNIRNIMPKVFRDSVVSGDYKDYVEDLTSIASHGVREDALAPNEDIYPSIAGVEVSGLGRIDEIIAVSEVIADKPDDENYSPTFHIWVKDIGFNLADEQYTSTQDAKISFTTGILTGYEFTILANGQIREVVEDTTKSFNGVSSKYRITLINSDEDFDATGRVLPNTVLKPSAGDHFVIYDIEMPFSYVANAEQRVQDWLEANLADLKEEKPTFSIEPMSSFFETAPVEFDGKTIKEKLRAGNRITINADIEHRLHINNLTIQYGGLMPKYSFTVTDRVQVQGGAVAKLQSQLDGVLSRQSLTERNIDTLLSGLSAKYLSKIKPDTAQGLITFLEGFTSKSHSYIEAPLDVDKKITANDGFTSKAHSYIEAPLDVDKKLTAKEGLQIGASFAGGLTGHGGTIDEVGNAELQSLILRTFLEVPELRFNRVDVIAGDLWNTRGAGIIEEVDTVNQIITLKLEKGEVGRFRYDDIVMGIFHSFNDEDNSVDDYDDGLGNRRYSGFGTSYFRVTQILDAERYSKFRYELRPISPRHPKQFHPQPFMTSAAYGNFTNEERQTSMYQTTSYIRLLRNVNNWEFGIENIGMQWGDLSNLSIFGLDMTGYSAYMENVYFSGIIHQLSAKIKEQLDAQRVGGKNLLREYDIRFGFKYWGNAGEYTEFDINQIESTPQLQVQPNTLNWTFPIRYGTVVVTANEVWNITTPSWLNAYPSAGSGNKNVDLKAGEYKGRDARTGTVAVQSGVIQRNVSISQAGLTEFVTIDPILNVSYEAQTVTITGKSNSSKLTFTTDTGYLEINLPAQYNANGTNVNNGSAIAGDPGALDEYIFSITVAVGENVEDFSIQNNIFATANGGEKAISTIVQRRARIKVLADTDNSVISIGNTIFHIN